MSADEREQILARCQGWCCRRGGYGPHVAVIRGPWIDEKGYQRAERINGMAYCDECGLWWPLIEDVEAWNARRLAIEWGPGAAQCLQCGRVYMDTFDGMLMFEP